MPKGDIYITANGFVLLSTCDKIYQWRLLDPFELLRALADLHYATRKH